MHIDYQFLRPQKAAALKELHAHSLYEKTELSVGEYEHASLVPIRYVQDSDGYLFGRGGALSADGSFIEASGMEKRYGASYEHEAPAERDERVMYCGYFSLGWGHFLLESVSRLWPVVSSDPPQVDRYVFIGNEGAGTKIGGNFREFLELLGIYEKTELLTAPARFREVVIPDLSYSFLHYYTPQYNGIFKRVIGNALSHAEGAPVDTLTPSEESYSETGGVSSRRGRICEEPGEGFATGAEFGKGTAVAPGAASVLEPASVWSKRGQYRKAPGENGSPPRRIFLSRRHVYDKKHRYGGTRPRERGLDMLDEYFTANGYTIVYPERVSLTELIHLMNGAEYIATESGSCAHNLLLAPKGAKVQIIERQAYVNDYQANIDVIRDLSVEYVDAHYSLYPVEPFGGPCLIMNTPQMQSFTKAHGFTPPPAKYDSPLYYRRALRWYLWLYRHLMGRRIMMEDVMLPYAAVFKECADDTCEAFRPWLETRCRRFFFRLWERIGYPRF